MESITKDRISDGAVDEEIRQSTVIMGDNISARPQHGLVSGRALELESLDQLEEIEE